MDFTQRELKLVERLRKQERRWQWTRWLLLGLAVFILLGNAYIARMLYSGFVTHYDSDAFSRETMLMIFAMFWPQILLMSGLAGAFIGLAIRDWHGNVTRMLLLKLLDAQEKQAGKDERST
jgi:hypothetical protein